MIVIGLFIFLVMTTAVALLAVVSDEVFYLVVQNRYLLSSIVGQGVVGALVFDFTGLFYIAIFSVLATGAIFISIRKSRKAKIRMDILADIASLVRRISDSVGGGSDLTNAILVSCLNPPAALEDNLKKLSRSLPIHGVEYALEEFAYEVDESSAHLLAAHLIQANRFPSGRLGPALKAIANEIESHIDSDRELATLRRQQEFEVRGLSLILAVVVGFVFIFMPGLTEVFSTTTGAQGLLGVIALAAAGWIIASRLNSEITAGVFNLRRNT